MTIEIVVSFHSRYNVAEKISIELVLKLSGLARQNVYRSYIEKVRHL